MSGEGRKLGRLNDNLDPQMTPPASFRKARSRIMYVEYKGDGVEGPARIGRVYSSKSGRSLYYRGKTFQSLAGAVFKANYFDVDSGEHYWISGPRKDRNDRLYGGQKDVEIDSDVRDE
ncbi:MAG: 1-deoxy-D-xylulose-5-phosphate synthase [Pseudomonadota bacterium]